MRADTGQRQPKRGRRARLLLALATVIAVVVVPQRPSAASTGSDEAAFVARINDFRASHGVPRLRVDGELTSQARHWAGVMARDDQLKHAGDLSVGISADWDLLGENVGTDSEEDVQAVFDAFVASPAHRANILDARFDYVGVGVVLGDAGQLWTTQRFMSVSAAPVPAPDPAPTPTTAAPAPPPAAEPGAGASSKPAPAPSPRPTPTTTPPTTAGPTTTEAPVLATRPLSDASPDPGLTGSSADGAAAATDPPADPGAGLPTGGTGPAGPGTPFAGTSGAGSLVLGDIRPGTTPLASALAGTGPLGLDPTLPDPTGALAGADPAVPGDAGATGRLVDRRQMVAQVLTELTGLDG